MRSEARKTSEVSIAADGSAAAVDDDEAELINATAILHHSAAGAALEEEDDEEEEEAEVEAEEEEEDEEGEEEDETDDGMSEHNIESADAESENGGEDAESSTAVAADAAIHRLRVTTTTMGAAVAKAAGAAGRAFVIATMSVQERGAVPTPMAVCSGAGGGNAGDADACQHIVVADSVAWM
eukprot:CAMPEP_0178375066 /NCGR_PEP_ID=MMETSP0689_2-20121128/2697_1 /TAXON_ID=160604 /ORGANISM="Amphidinium massartii, Strain CS-259" /LENGTH=181 /DNA_ID=CAMNT_0019995049 /DNA_START=126 /DNA_END=672 /DNA_ORIENTATION=+